MHFDPVHRQTRNQFMEASPGHGRLHVCTGLSGVLADVSVGTTFFVRNAMQEIIVAAIVLSACWVELKRYLPRAVRQEIARRMAALAVRCACSGLAQRLQAASVKVSEKAAAAIAVPANQVRLRRKQRRSRSAP